MSDKARATVNLFEANKAIIMKQAVESLLIGDLPRADTPSLLRACGIVPTVYRRRSLTVPSSTAQTSFSSCQGPTRLQVTAASQESRRSTLRDLRSTHSLASLFCCGRDSGGLNHRNEAVLKHFTYWTGIAASPQGKANCSECCDIIQFKGA